MQRKSTRRPLVDAAVLPRQAPARLQAMAISAVTIIAAHALSLDATLVTNNVREFGRVPGLNVENWVEDPP